MTPVGVEDKLDGGENVADDEEKARKQVEPQGFGPQRPTRWLQLVLGI